MHDSTIVLSYGTVVANVNRATHADRGTFTKDRDTTAARLLAGQGAEQGIFFSRGIYSRATAEGVRPPFGKSRQGNSGTPHFRNGSVILDFSCLWGKVLIKLGYILMGKKAMKMPACNSVFPCYRTVSQW